jgi:hypothetical protein
MKLSVLHRLVPGRRDARNAVRRIEQWRLVPTDDATFTLGNLTGGRREVKVVLPRSS